MHRQAGSISQRAISIVAACLVGGAALAACSSSSLDSNPSPDASAQTTKETVLSMSLTVPAGDELHECQLVQVPSGADLDIVRIGHEYTPGSHHFLLYETNLTSIPNDLTGHYDCTLGDEPIMAHARGILYAGQSPKGEFAFPPGVGFTLKAGSVVMFQTHYINPSNADLAAKVDLRLTTASADAIKEKAGFLIFYSPFIHLPANGTGRSGIRCGIPNEIKLLNGFTHYHQRGKGMKVYVDPPAAPPAATPFFETADWEHPADWVGPMTIPAGSKVRFSCEYDNSQNGTEIFQGPNAKTSEMCVFAGLYYPVPADDEFETCDQLSIIGTGSKPCYEVASCIQSCPDGEAPVETWSGVKVGPCWERCVAKGCDGAVDTFIPLAVCIGKQCGEECKTGNCLACMSEKCGLQFDACSNHACK